MSNRIRYEVYPPNCLANPHPDKWLCEIRDGGWIADWKLHDSEQAAQAWGAGHDGTTAPKANKAIADMAVRWANK